jgi:hypothetical protein
MRNYKFLKLCLMMFIFMSASVYAACCDEDEDDCENGIESIAPSSLK